MHKIMSLFNRDYEGNHQVYNEVVPGAEWVLAGEGVATEKIDGTCCMARDGQLYKRYDSKKGKTPPEGFIPAQKPDEVTGHWPGWLLVENGPEDKWHSEALSPDSPANCGLLDGTYELCGPKVQGNPYQLNKHVLYPHGSVKLLDNPRTFEDIGQWLVTHNAEGIVWHHPDGRKVKIKRRDFGLAWPIK